MTASFKSGEAVTSTLAPENQPIAHYAELQKVPYLGACLDENFRCKAPVAVGLPRRTVREGQIIAGHYIPADTVVSVPLYTLQRDERLFKNASAFIPERWLTDDEEHTPSEKELQNLKDFVLPFSLGGRVCIGRNLAFMELSVVIAALVMGFRVGARSERKRARDDRKLNCNPKNLFVRAKAREGVSLEV